MNPITVVTLWVSGMALVFSIGACIVSARLLALCRSTSCAMLSARLTELTGLVESLSEDQAKLRARANMQAWRAKKREEPSADPPLTVTEDGDKARVRRELGAKLASGVIKPFGRS